MSQPTQPTQPTQPAQTDTPIVIQSAKLGQKVNHG